MPTAINLFDQSEVSSIGFHVADFGGLNPDAILRLQPIAIPEPTALLALAVW